MFPTLRVFADLSSVENGVVVKHVNKRESFQICVFFVDDFTKRRADLTDVVTSERSQRECGPRQDSRYSSVFEGQVSVLQFATSGYIFFKVIL